MSQVFFNKKAEIWDQIVEHDDKKIKKVINNIKSVKNPEILDVGSGTGVLIPYLTKKFGELSKITAIDFAENMIAVSRKKHKQYKNIKYIIADIYSIELNSSYDLIFSYSVFPHFNDKKGILKKFKSNLNEEGKVIIFHSQSREKINNLHKKASSEVNSDYLPAAIDLANMAEMLGYKVLQIIDNNELYLVELQKSS